MRTFEFTLKACLSGERHIQTRKFRGKEQNYTQWICWDEHNFIKHV